MRTLVTGGAGFIGSHLVEALVAAGHEVCVVDNLTTGKRANLSEVLERIDFVETDLLAVEQYEARLAGVDVVFHQAALVSVPLSVAQPETCHRICATGTLELLRACQRQQVRRFVYAASSSAYGMGAETALRETDPLHALSPYAAAKLAGEFYCTAATATSSLETVRLRYFNVFGPRQDPGSPYSGVIALFSAALLQGRAATIFGDGNQSRDFVFVRDVVAANLLAAQVPNIAGKVFNIGCNRRISVLNLYQSLQRLIPAAPDPQFAPPRLGDVLHSLADISKAREELGFEPQTSWEEGLQVTLEFYRTLFA